MPKPYMALRCLMKVMGWEQKDLAKVIGKNNKYVGDKLNLRGKHSWDLQDCFKILEAAGKPDSDFLKYFPRDPWERVDF